MRLIIGMVTCVVLYYCVSLLFMILHFELIVDEFKLNIEEKIVNS